MCLPLCGQRSCSHQSWTGLYEGQTYGACPEARMVVDGVYGHPFRLPAGFPSGLLRVRDDRTFWTEPISLV